MTVWLQEQGITLYHGDAVSTLTELKSSSADCIVTSPPYYGLRDYGEADQIGLEDSPDEYVNRLVEVFREARRVLSRTGTLWLNLGDSFYSGKGASHGIDARCSARRFGVRPLDRSGLGVPRKSLLGMPWRVALRLQQDGWIIRNSIVWHKPNAMPDNARDRLDASYELVFLLTTNRYYHFDRHAIEQRNDVWRINTKPSGVKHYATYPEELPSRCIRAGCPGGGTVLDPFHGVGTTALAARALGMNYIGIDINADYLSASTDRLAANRAKRHDDR